MARFFRRGAEDARYVILCRHGPHRSGVLTTVDRDGRSELPSAEIGERLRQTVKDLERGTVQTSPRAGRQGARVIHVTAVVHARSPEAAGTAVQLVAALQRSGVGPPKAAVCKALVEGTSVTDTKCVRTELLRRAGKQPGGAVLAVGHQPQMSWIADDLLNGTRRWGRRPPTPIDRAGLVCIRVPKSGRGQLVWTISYDDAAAATAIREKIQRKMDTAKLLSGAVAFGLTATFGLLLDGSKLRDVKPSMWAVQASGVFLLLAAILYFATMYAYDTLLMPQRFWGERRPPAGKVRQRRGGWLVDRPPSSAAWVLYQNMMRIWRNLFVSASACVGIGIGLLGYAALRLEPWRSALIGLGIVVVAALLIWWSRPVLGSED